MQTNKLPVNSANIRLPAAMKRTEDAAMRLNLSKKEMLQLQLLVEETLGMVCAMTEDFEGAFWLEYEGRTCRVCLEVETHMSLERKEMLLALSSSGKNASRKGFMGKIADMMENGLLFYDNVGALQAQYGLQINAAESGYTGAGGEMISYPVWTLSSYKEELSQKTEGSSPSEEAWDELEKSIVAKLSDDVTVGVKNRKAEFIIEKTFKRRVKNG